MDVLGDLIGEFGDPPRLALAMLDMQKKTRKLSA